MREASSNEELENTTFSTTLRGYDRDEVDAFVRTVAQEMRELHHGRTEKLYESLGEEMGGLLQHARDSADEMTRGAEKQATATRSQAEADAQQARQEAEADAQKTREDAAARALELQQKAGQQASETRAEADREASTRIAEATDRVRQLEETEGQARARVKSLREEVASIANDLRLIESTPETEPAGQATDRSSEADAGPTSADDAKEHTTIRLEPQESSIR